MAELTITFLGTGTSQGVPVIGCDCAVCTSEDPRDRRMRSSVYVQTPNCSWVIDTGPDFRSQALRHGVRAVDAVVYTHAHTDHIMGFDDLRPFCEGGRVLPIYASEDTMGHLSRVFEFAFNGLNRWPGYMHPDPRVITAPFVLDTLEIEALPLVHGRTMVNGYLLRDRATGESLVGYLSDCKLVPEESRKRLLGVRHLIVDALRHRLHPTHMNVEEALALAAEVRPGQTWFTHLCHDMGHAAVEAGLPARVRVAFDGVKIEL
jgi:phosphoribosyl 1,2-cyclic phosphate phosphodiesterase